MGDIDLSDIINLPPLKVNFLGIFVSFFANKPFLHSWCANIYDGKVL
ncbi:hypothetical protein H1P_1810025 [Hyella patelloides LEGE 07179]|uniref:Uncharacterized protein n=1 Tax=Hyella patelloides LEGE 07179 TaxID=945734 RepID=A0A563VNP6_9CYAN|nr:hypothetical protein H1P_1810025 [Hyella patelloides LEGE 07179]